MDQKELRLLEDRCIQENPPACTATCPVHVDVRSFLAEMARGNIDGAYAVYRKTIPFAGIVGRVCDHPCQAACKRGEAGGTIAIAALERACVQLAAPKTAKVPALQKKDQCVAVAGGGLSGLVAAFDLAAKGYGVTVFEAEGRLGGRLWHLGEDVLPGQVILEETASLERLGVRLQLGTAVGRDVSLPELDFDAVYLGLGETVKGLESLELDDRGRVAIDPLTFATSFRGVFAGGSMLTGETVFSIIGSVSHGRRAAVSIDRYVQGASLTASRDREGPYVTRLFTSIQGVEPLPVVSPRNPEQGYTREEAVSEAQRCLQCQCLECVKACEYLASYRGYPKRYIREIYNNESMVKGQHTANGLINSCSLCGLCAEVCPNGLDMGEVCKTARGSMVQKGKMPPSVHDFALRDMEFSNGNKFALVKAEPGQHSCAHLFFPGCQLSGSSPEYVAKAYAYLREGLTGRVGLGLRCCGAPAEWAGRSDLFREGLYEIRHQWHELGQPRIITACSSCYAVFKQNLPGVDIVSLWEIYDQIGLPEGTLTHDGYRVAVHDACATRHESHIQASVRHVLERLGCRVEELAYGRGMTECCGFGGLMSFANPGLAAKVIDRRAGESGTDYVAYCAMCRDRLASRGKPALHILDLIYGRATESLALRPDPGYSQRHENRARLKARLLKEVWGEKVADPTGFENVKLEISGEIKTVMENRLILVEDVQKVIEYAERTGNKLVNQDRFLAYFKPVSVTYWVEYAPAEEGFRVYNAYSHRMEIAGEVQR
ncbi:MAG TPA: 4Fe-4S dicluster domain-containing protein [Spirochaetia bacterium]|nr:4Fe-4S dicluster domain-containing protein [Spirochaetia bacterium]